MGEAATTKRTDGAADDDAGKDEFLPVMENEVAQVSGIKQTAAPDAAVAVNVADLEALVEHARKTGAEELAAKFPNL